MGKSIRSKPMRRNRQLKRTVYGPKEDAKLKSAIAFAYNEQNEKAHLSIFHEAMNGPPPPVPGLEPGSKLERAHLTLAHQTQEKIQALLQLRSERKVAAAAKALTKGAEPDPDDRIFERKRLAKVAKRPVREDDKMDNEVVRVYDPKTNRDQFGHYPVWYNSKKIRKLAHANKVQKKKNLRRIMRGKKPLPPPKPKGDGLNDLDDDEEEDDEDDNVKGDKNVDVSDDEMEC